MNTSLEEIFHDVRYDDVTFLDGEQITIGFRRVLLILSKEEFYTWLQLLRKAFDNIVWEQTKNQTVLVNTSCPKICLLLNAAELKRLLTMLESTNNYFERIHNEGCNAIRGQYSF